MVVYNISNITAATTPWLQFEAINQLSGGFLTMMIIVALYIVLFVVFKHHEIQVVMLGLSFIMFIISIFAVFLELIGLSIAMISAVLFFACLILFLFIRRD